MVVGENEGMKACQTSQRFSAEGKDIVVGQIQNLEGEQAKEG